MLRTICRNVILSILPRHLSDRLLAFKQHLWWKLRARKTHLIYNDDYRSRSWLIDPLINLFGNTTIGALSVLEYGCSGANNLRLMRETLPFSVSYSGVDIQPEAIAFARREFPSDTFYVCDERKLPQLAPKLGHFDVFLASAVLRYITEAEVEMLLKCARMLADNIIVYDYLSCMSLPDGVNNGVFHHPYRKLCRNAGLEIVRICEAGSEGKDCGYFIARGQG
jgi:SAM-dependent methyltransferase